MPLLVPGLIDVGAIFLVVAALMVCVCTGAVAYRWPLVMVAAAVVSAQMLGHEATAILPASRRLLLNAPIQLRYFDPVLLGIGAATTFRILVGLRRPSRPAMRTYAFLGVLFLWMALILLKSVPRFGAIAALGEFRAYYAHLILVPYICTSFRTPERQWQLFRLLIALSLLFIPLAALRGYILHDFHVGPRTRWITAFGNLAVVLGTVALIVAARYGQMKLRMATFVIICTLAGAITLTNGHRSVWLWIAVGGMVMLLRRTASLKRVVQLSLGLLVVFVLAQPWLAQQGLGIGEYFGERLTAFRDFSSDNNAAWRYLLWVQSIERIRGSPVDGLGFGGNFHLFGQWGEVITTSPHNHYITIAYHAGVTALLLYLAFYIQAIVGVVKSLKAVEHPRERVILETGLVALVAAIAYYVTYTLEYFTWLYVGLALATVITIKSRQAFRARMIHFPPGHGSRPRLVSVGPRTPPASARELAAPAPVGGPESD